MHRKRILVVDDEEDVTAATVATLQLAEYSVESALSADEALVKAEQQHFDLVLLDFILPPTNGLELLARIRQKRPLVRSIILSGKILSREAADVAVELKESVDADDYLHKPVAASELLAKVEALLSEEPATDWQKIAVDFDRAQQQTIKAAAQAAKFLMPNKPKGNKK